MPFLARASVVAVLLALLPSFVCGAGDPPPRFLARWSQSGDGLPGNVVRSVVQAASGYLWVATAEGIVRFDGVRFTGFEAQPDRVLARLPARSLIPFPDGSVWIATTRNGLLRWDRRRLHAILPETDKPGPVLQVVPAGAGALVLFGKQVLRVAADGSVSPEARTPEIEALLQADAKSWAEHGRDTRSRQLPHLRDRAGRTWRAQPAGLTVSLTPEGEQFPIPNFKEHCLELHEDGEGNLWAATSSSGLLCLTEAKVQVLTTAEGLSELTPQALLEDRDGALWIGTKNGSIDRLDANGATHFELPTDLPKAGVSALFQDRAGILWAASGRTIYRQAQGGFEAVAFTPKNDRISAIVEDAEGRLFFGGWVGVGKWEKGTFEFLEAPAGGTPQNIITLAVDAADILWAGTAGGGLYRKQGERFELLPGSEIMEGAAVSSLLPEADGTMWLTTLGAGLFRWKEGSLTRFSSEEGLPDPRLTCALDDRAGHLWLGSLAGIFRLDRAELERRSTGAPDSLTTLVFNRADGLISRECTGRFQPAGVLRSDGTVAFPTTSGVALIKPTARRSAEALLPVIIEECRVNGHPLAPLPSRWQAGPWQAGPGRSRLEFRYTAPSFSAPGKIKFRARLAGLEDTWREVGPLRTIAFEAVPPGRYRFEVVAANSAGIWNAEGAHASIEVLPHFWEQRWFRVLAGAAGALLIGATAWGAERVRTRPRLLRLEADRARQAERVRIAQDLHDDLGSRLTEISLLAGFADDDPAQEKRVLRALPEIVSKTRALAGALDEIVWAVNPRYDTVHSLMEYLAAFAAEFLAAAGVAARFDLPTGLPPVALDPERRHSLFLAIREALHNAVKHAGATEVWLRVRCEEGALHLMVEDNGTGFDPAVAKVGEGLGNLARRLQQLGGEFTMESVPGQGTHIHLRVPMQTCG